VTNDDLDRRPVRERLKGVDDPDEIARLLGRRRTIGYPLVALLSAVACIGFLAYMAYRVLSGQMSGWSLLAAPIFILLAVAFGTFSYACAYSEITGRRWSGADRVEAIARRLDSNV
jgi:hypothetical protein